MTRKFFIIPFILIFLNVSSCGRNRRPGLSDKELFAQNNVEKLQPSEPEPDFSDMETYVVPSGIKYKGSRAVDPANPPVVLNIANRNLNIRKFNLGDYYTKVRYINLKHPMSASKGFFNLDAIGVQFADGGVNNTRLQRLNFKYSSQFQFTNDCIIAGDMWYGLHCYDNEGNFLNTIETNDYYKEYKTYASRNFISFAVSELKGFYGRINVNGNYCLYNVMENNKGMLCLYDLKLKERILTRPFEESHFLLDNKTMASYTYEPVLLPENFLYTFDIKGDTLCRFRSYQPVPEIRGGSYFSPPSPDIYYSGNRLTIRQVFNDTVFRVVSPDRLLPAYVLNFGTYQADIPTFFRGNISEKLLPVIWKEADRYILFTYTQNRNSLNNRREGSVKFFYSYYDKNSRQFYHFSEGTTVSDDEFLLDNSVPDALPVLLKYVDIEDNQLRVVYSKKRLEEIINNKEFASFSPELQNKLKALQNELDDSEVMIMILE